MSDSSYQTNTAPELLIGQAYCYKHGITYPCLIYMDCPLCKVENNSSHTSKKPFPRDEEWEEGITN